MSIARRDYILRLIEQFAETLARIVGLRKAGKPDEALKLVRETADGLFGSMRSMLERVDAEGAAVLLGAGEKVVLYATLTAEEAEIVLAMGDSRKAEAGRRRALELYLEASRMGPLDIRARAAIELLRRTLDESRLDHRCREMLASLHPPT